MSTKLTLQEITDGLSHLGFPDGWAISGEDYDNLLLWEHDAPKPTAEAVKAAAPLGAQEREAKAAAATSARQKIADASGLTPEEIAALGF